MPFETRDVIKKQRRALVINALKKGPKTLNELSVATGISKWPCRDTVVFLQEIGQIQILPYGQGKANVYALSKLSLNPKSATLAFSGNGSTNAFHQVALSLAKGKLSARAPRRLAQLLAYNYIYTRERNTQKIDWEYGPGCEETRQRLGREIEILEGLVGVLKQMFAAPVWDESKDAFAYLGPCSDEDYAQLSDLSRAYCDAVLQGHYPAL